MGATGWRYIVPYRPDMEAVLTDLHREVFASGRYQKPRMELDLLDELGFFEVDEAEREAMIEEYTLRPLREPLERLGPDGLRAWLEELQDAPRVGSMDELAVCQCLTMDGTGTILDIGTTSPVAAEGALFPLADADLRAAFGTDRPTRAMAEDWFRRRDASPEAMPYGRYGGVYVVLHEEGQPREIYIEGASGD